jgi:hypothetical protein
MPSGDLLNQVLKLFEILVSHQKVPKFSRKGFIAERSFLKRNENAMEFRRVRQGVLEGDSASIGVFFDLVEAGIDRVENDGESPFHRKVGSFCRFSRIR